MISTHLTMNRFMALPPIDGAIALAPNEPQATRCRAEVKPRSVPCDCARPSGEAHANRPWQCLYFLPEPHGQGSLRPTLPQDFGSPGLRCAERAAEKPPAAPAAPPAGASASAISSSPVVGSTLCASMNGSVGLGPNGSGDG